jgi:lipopolysaccharide biosynthesis glycosyltransferase
VNDDITKVFEYANKFYALNCINSGPGNYFGGGFFLINLTKAKNKFNLNMVRSVYDSNPEIKWMDQDLLNIIFKDDSIKNIPYVWDFPVQNYLLNKRSFHNNNLRLRDAKSIHFPGTTKPWRFSTILPFAREWRKVYLKIYKSSPWSKITIKEFLLRFLYLIFWNPSTIFKISKKLKNTKTNGEK